ncbi:unnamed protein product [Boreogadus saida]
MRRPTPRSSSSFSSSLCPKVSASTPMLHTNLISWARHGAPGGTEADHQAVLKRQRSRGGGQLMAISAGGPAGEGHPSWGRDIRLRDVKAAEDPPGFPWRTAMGLLEVFGSTSVQNAHPPMAQLMAFTGPGTPRPEGGAVHLEHHEATC